MKKFKFLLPIFAFAIAIAGAFGTYASEESLLVTPNKYFLNSGTPCDDCTAIDASAVCGTTGSTTPCTCWVGIQSNIKSAKAIVNSECVPLVRTDL